MGKRWISPLSSLILGSFVFLVGCAALNPASKSSTSSQQPGGTGQDQSSSAGMRSGQVTESSQSSSLEAFRRGQEVPSTSRRSAASPLKDIHFDFDRYSLQPEARQTLKGNAGWLKANPSGRIEIEGHADDRGTNEYNLALDRLRSVVDHKLRRGVAGLQGARGFMLAEEPARPFRHHLLRALLLTSLSK
jgi:outer membrane protein OmpA-like peptidoglycan-associated protein